MVKEWTYVKGAHWNNLYEAIVLGKADFVVKSPNQGNAVYYSVDWW